MTSILVDANVLIDIVQPVPDRFSVWGAARLNELAPHAPFVVNVEVAAELSFQFDAAMKLEQALPTQLWLREPVPFEAAFLAGQAHRRYRERGGRRERTLPDFLIGAHAQVAGHRLLTRDGARYRTYFPDLDIICPETHP
ncbi:type II toxin-antitoxin system VapC family toxin [Aureimonas jatrophae]|uniref:PIN domain-containing protein n=1 Tax=Aureimonas jatrophae TaxID=1166073 RepID=A0A1H0CI51_9HYPH|nr:type II toxin-antitoxin system VapC family toxin [Aureimonas jatrophae]MBB3949243.1 hypothetical protein [Aureimonas jatrophae]SDN57549.1 hypothetical protein SAMN05192530_101317 [Aureimonas jatrophae]